MVIQSINGVAGNLQVLRCSGLDNYITKFHRFRDMELFTTHSTPIAWMVQSLDRTPLQLLQTVPIKVALERPVRPGEKKNIRQTANKLASEDVAPDLSYLQQFRKGLKQNF